MPYVRVKGISHAYGERTLFAGFSFELERGRILQVNGVNGSGKSTMLQLLAGIKSCQQGSIDWSDGTSFSYIGHKNSIKAELTPLENLSLYQPDSASCARAIEDMGLESSHHNQQCYMLSAGQQRKTALARLLLDNTNVWLLDEPFTALDDASKKRLCGQLERHAEAGGSAVVATHEALDVKNSVITELVVA